MDPEHCAVEKSSYHTSLKRVSNRLLILGYPATTFHANCMSPFSHTTLLTYFLLTFLPSFLSSFLSFHLSSFLLSLLLSSFHASFLPNVSLWLLRLHPGSKTENQTRKRYPVSPKKVIKAIFYSCYFIVHFF
jgi:hypothetical protein